MSNSEEADINKLLKHFPVDADITLQVLKGHLIIEETLREIFDRLLISPRALNGEKGTSFTCHQIICLVEGLVTKRSPKMEWIWSAAKQLNNLRNDMAHKLNPQGLDSKIDSFLRYVWTTDPDVGAQFKSLGAPSRLEFAMAVSVLFGVFSKIRDNITPHNPHGT